MKVKPKETPAEAETKSILKEMLGQEDLGSKEALSKVKVKFSLQGAQDSEGSRLTTEGSELSSVIG